MSAWALGCSDEVYGPSSPPPLAQITPGASARRIGSAGDYPPVRAAHGIRGRRANRAAGKRLDGLTTGAPGRLENADAIGGKPHSLERAGLDSAAYRLFGDAVQLRDHCGA